MNKICDINDKVSKIYECVELFNCMTLYNSPISIIICLPVEGFEYPIQKLTLICF